MKRENLLEQPLSREEVLSNNREEEIGKDRGLIKDAGVEKAEKIIKAALIGAAVVGDGRKGKISLTEVAIERFGLNPEKTNSLLETLIEGS